MKFSTLSAASFLTVVLFILGMAFSTGPADNGTYRTGAPSTGGGIEGTCSQCHNSGNFGEPAVSLTVAETSGGTAVTSYIPGQTYFVNVNVTAAMGTPAAYGFQSVFLKNADNTQAGSFASPGTLTQISSGNAGRFYPEHSGRTASGSWDFQWTAPAVSTGPVDIYVVGNSVNGAGGSSGDSGSTSPTIVTLSESALPAELISISARSEKSSVELSWVTATEDNVSHFEVERSTDGAFFNRINQVSARGFSQSAHSYTHTDEAASTGLNYYRLKIMDLDGSFAYSPVVSATVDVVALKLGAFPNPTRALVSFSNEISPETVLTLRDGLGHQLWSGQAAGGIDLSPYPAGIYLLEGLIDGQRTIERIVKQ